MATRTSCRGVQLELASGRTTRKHFSAAKLAEVNDRQAVVHESFSVADALDYLAIHN